MPYDFRVRFKQTLEYVAHIFRHSCNTQQSISFRCRSTHFVCSKVGCDSMPTREHTHTISVLCVGCWYAHFLSHSLRLIRWFSSCCYRRHRSIGRSVCVLRPLVEAQRDIVRTFFRLSWFQPDFRCVHICTKYCLFVSVHTPFSLCHPFTVNLVFRELLLVSVVNAILHILFLDYTFYCTHLLYRLPLTLYYFWTTKINRERFLFETEVRRVEK